MLLLQLDGNDGFSLVERIGNDIPRYAILSHTWGRDDEEPTFQDLMSDKAKRNLATARFASVWSKLQDTASSMPG
ncbi:hypothetical protein CC80DRAFT_494446 [Byssothecium circinans]|uniref:Heterokaryon incompatibility domain-containing protein n=1 Tax=Byssothecium circinans TaxID=147558 RepID=A0A6A5TPC5_9PLEO|nr:hypothetical protein CC80DRAFT_494446 [Byssothecium circinans]